MREPMTVEAVGPSQVQPPTSPDGGWAVRLWMFQALGWLALGPFIGLLQSTQFFWPTGMEVLDQVGLPYSKLRIMHTNVVIYGWLGMAFVAATLHVVPALVRAPLRHARLAVMAAWVWTASLVASIALIWLGLPGSALLSVQPYEYAEAPIVADLLATASLALVAVSITATVVRRQVRGIYVSIWYLVAAVFGTIFAYAVVNYLTLAFTGLGNQMLHAWWLHNAVGVFITPFGLGVAYYVIPKCTGRPIYSHRLGILGFWTLYLFYPGIGMHHFLQMPMPTWLNEFAVISSVLLVIPVVAVVYNHLATIAQNSHHLVDSFVLRFAFLGAIYYLLTGVQGSSQATNSFNPIIHFTEWVQAHAHLALTAAFSCFAMAGVTYIFPRVTGRQIVGRGALSVVFWTMAIGFPIFWGLFTLSGLFAAAGVGALGHSVYEVVPTQTLARLGRSVAGGALVVAFWLFAGVIFRSLRSGEVFKEGMDEVARSTRSGQAPFGAREVTA